MKLTGEQEAVLLRAARAVADDQRDRFFALVAAELKGATRHRNADVKAAVCSARQRCGGPKTFDVVEYDNNFLLTV